MSLSVGIQENVAFDVKVGEVNGQPVFNVLMSQPQSAEELFDFETATTEGSSGDTTSVTSWALKTKGYENGSLVDVRSPQAIMKDYQDKRAFLTAFLGLYTDPKDLSWHPFEGLDINTDSIRANPKLLQDDDVLAVMSKNIFTQAANYFKEFGDTTKLFRVPLIRTSKKSNAPKLRDKQLDKNPLAESMDVPATESKVAYTKYEIDQKQNDPTPAPSDGDTSYLDTLGEGQVKDPAGVPSNL